MMDLIFNNTNRNIEADAEYRLLARVAWLYYMGNMTQEVIGKRMGLSRVKINRLISIARREGIVQVTIKLPEFSYPDLEQKLCSRYSLKDAVVMMDTEAGEPMYRVLAQGTADWLTPRMSPEQTIGISLGRTLSYLPLVFKTKEKIACTFIEVLGGLSDSSRGFRGYNVIARMAELTGGKMVSLHVPTVISNANTRQVIIEEPSVAKAFEQARRSHILLSSVGPIDHSALLYVHGYLKKEDLVELQKRGAVGDVLGHFIDKEGQPVQCFLDDLIMALSLDDLKSIPYSVLVAGGSKKLESISGALKAGYFNVIITDVKTAQSLLEDSPE